MDTGQKSLCSQLKGTHIHGFLDALGRLGVSPDDIAHFRRCPADMMLVAEAVKDAVRPKNHVHEMISLNLGPDRYFGPADWERCFGLELQEGFALPMPIEQLREILESPCPFFPGKRVKETHYLFCLPADFRGIPLTVKKWQEMFPAKSQPHFRTYISGQNWDLFCGATTELCNYVAKDTARHSWFLMFEGVIPGSVNMTWDEQLAMKPKNYEVPKVVEVIPMYFLAHKKNNGMCINDNMLGRTSDLCYPETARISAGGFDPCGFRIGSLGNHDDRLSGLGIFLFRRLDRAD